MKWALILVFLMNDGTPIVTSHVNLFQSKKDCLETSAKLEVKFDIKSCVRVE